MNPSYLVGNRLRDERERLGLSQAEAGAMAGVSREMWGRYERGALPGGEVFVLLGSTEMDVLYIITGQRSQPLASSPDEEMLMGAYRRASLAQKQAILGAAIGVAPPPQAVGNVSGGSVVQTAQGNGVVQVGKISSSKPRR